MMNYTHSFFSISIMSILLTLSYILWTPCLADDLFDFCETPEVEAIITETQWDIATSCTNKADVIFILSQIKIPQLLAQNFYLRSNNIISRPLLDYPEFIPFVHDQEKRALGFHLFYNQTNRGYFTKNSSNICSYLAISNPDFLAALAAVITAAKQLNDFTFNPQVIFDILGLFEPFTIQERRFGLMFYGKGKVEQWHLHTYVPWYYLERNHFVNQREQDEIERIITELTGTVSNPSEQKQFQDAHFISDTLGIGDTRVYFDYPVLKKAAWKMRLGGIITAPTAFAMVRGLRGSHFTRVRYAPCLDLCKTFNNALSGTPLSELQAVNFFLGALDNLSAILLDSPLGNGGHFELGLYLKNKAPVSEYIPQRWARRLLLRSFTSVQYLIPAWKTRSFIIPPNSIALSSPLITDPNNAATLTPSEVEAFYDLLTRELSNRFFPIALPVKVHPGFVFHNTSHLLYESAGGGWSLGNDFWIRSGEQFSDIQACGLLHKVLNLSGEEFTDIQTCRLLNPCTAESSIAYQSKIYGSAFFKVKKPGMVWTIGFGGDYTYWNKGIGQDFTLMFNVDLVF